MAAKDSALEETSTPLGLTLGFFKRFIEIHGGRDAFENLTTGAPDGHLYAKPATWFVSHAWSYLYLDVADALDDFFQENGLDDAVAVWFCTFCNNQHEIQDQVYDFDHWFGIYRSSLRSVGNVVMVMSPWNDPTTLRRTWCVFEVYASVVENARFEIAMGRSQKASFLQDIQDDGAFYKMLSTIQSEKSETTIPSDRDNIFQLIRDEVGFVKLDRMVFEVLEKWMLRTVDQQIEQAADVLSRAGWLMVKGTLLRMKSDYGDAAIVFRSAHDIYLCGKGPDCPDAWKALADTAAAMLERGGALDEVATMSEEALGHQIRLLSKDHEETLSSEDHPDTSRMQNNVGIIYLMLGKTSSALPFIQGSYEVYRRTLGDDHKATLLIQANLGNTFRLVGNFAESERILLDCLEKIQSDALAKAVCVRNLGLLYLCKHDYEVALTYYKEGLALMAEAYNRSNANYTRAIPPYFLLKMKTGCFEKLEEIDAFEKELIEAECYQDSWKNFQCHGCRGEIQGVVYECSKCPIQSLRYCRACIDLNKPESFCNHGMDAIMTTKPMARYIQEERLKLLAIDATWREYDHYFLKYEAYCDANKVPLGERLPKDMSTREQEEATSCCSFWFWR
ncbi:hypothetical protein LEN26_015652 [Aphanomyces euteiches]|nr:hypothetical protein LEN26_015652 [Aphanomyces euteiches]